MKRSSISCFLVFNLLLITPLQNAYAQTTTSAGELSQRSQAHIEALIDSATIRLADGRKMRMIGLIPIERPQTKEAPRNEYNIIIEKEDPIIPFEQAVYDTLRDLLTDQDIFLEFDALYRDREGYILCYVFLQDGTLVNAEILRQGFSNLTITPPNTKYEKELRAAYLEAKKEKRGLQGN